MRMLRLIILLQLTVFSAFSAFADGFDEYPSLRESFDPGLQAGLERTLASLDLQRAIDRRKLAVALVDITDPRDPRVASVNGDEMMYAASLPKLAILLGAFVQIENGDMKLDADTQNSLTRMIRVSSNQDATRMLNRVGKQTLIDILCSQDFRLYDPAVNGGLWVGKEYGRSQAYHRDPLHHLSHGATAIQTARFYYLMETGRLVSPKLTRIMRSMLGEPEIHHKFVKGLEGVPEAKIFRKSGTWRQWHSDSALVVSGQHKYIVVALAESARGGRWLTNMIEPIHRLIVPQRVALTKH